MIKNNYVKIKDYMNKLHMTNNYIMIQQQPKDLKSIGKLTT